MEHDVLFPPGLFGAVGAGAVANALMKDMPTVDDQKFWGRYGWIVLPDNEERNLDALDKERLPARGCPSCGGVWTSLVAAGFPAPRVYSGQLAPEPARLMIAKTHQKMVAIEAFQIECFSGHVFKYHESTRRLTPVPASHAWPLLATMALGAIGYILGSAVATRKP